MNRNYAPAYWPEVSHGNGYEPEYYEPANLAWLDEIQARHNVSLAERRVLQPPTGLQLVQGGKVGKSRSTALLKLAPRPVSLPRRYGLQAIIRIANELEYALNHIQCESDLEMLFLMEPHLRRVDQIARQLTRVTAKARRQTEREYSLFED